MSKITVREYDYSKKEETVVVQDLSIHSIAKSLTAEQLAELFTDYLNSYSSPLRAGQKFGEQITEAHRTLQGCAVNFMASALIGFADSPNSKYTDARNEKAVELARALAKTAKETGFQPFI